MEQSSEWEAETEAVGLPAHARMLEEICQEEGLRLSWLSNNWVAMLEKDGAVRFVSGYKFGLDSHAVGEILDDKFALFEILKAQGLPVIPHQLLYAENCREKFAQKFQSREYILDFIDKYSLPIVIKPNNGTGGCGVYRLSSIDELSEVLEKVFRKSFSASMCPFYRFRAEYRVVWLKGEARLVYAKRPTEAVSSSDDNGKVGNGANGRDGDNDDSGENWKFNLKQGARAEKVLDGELKERLVNLARRAANAVNLQFGSIDISELENGELLIMELNSGVMIKRYLRQHPEDYGLVKQIYHDAVQEMFRT